MKRKRREGGGGKRGRDRTRNVGRWRQVHEFGQARQTRSERSQASLADVIAYSYELEIYAVDNPCQLVKNNSLCSVCY